MQLLWLTIILDPPISPRWERFAPGPVREVVVHPDKKILASAKAASKKRAAKDQTSEPKKRGRPPKKIVAKEGDDNPFNGDQSEAAPLAVPPADAAMLEIVPTEEPQPSPAEPAQEEPHGEQKAQPPPPNRSTFAGRTRVGSQHSNHNGILEEQCTTKLFQSTSGKIPWSVSTGAYAAKWIALMMQWPNSLRQRRLMLLLCQLLPLLHLQPRHVVQQGSQGNQKPRPKLQRNRPQELHELAVDVAVGVVRDAMQSDSIRGVLAFSDTWMPWGNVEGQQSFQPFVILSQQSVLQQPVTWTGDLGSLIAGNGKQSNGHAMRYTL